MDIVDNINALLEIQGTDLSEVLDHNSFSNILIECRDEIDKLRGELADQSAITVDYIIEKRKLESDNERLREENESLWLNNNMLQDILEMKTSARAALKGDE